MGLFERLRSLIREIGGGGKGLLRGFILLSIDLRAIHALCAFAHRVWIGFKSEIPQMKGILRWTT